MSDKGTERVKAFAKKKFNGLCFDCGQTGANYVIISQELRLAVFVCASCGGLHRDLDHRAKGVSLSTFKEEEAAFLEELGGNRAQRAVWWAHFDVRAVPIDPNDKDKMKKVMEAVYVQKRWHVDNPASRGRPPALVPEGGDRPSSNSRRGSAAAPVTTGAASGPSSSHFGFDFNTGSSSSAIPVPAPAPAFASASSFGGFDFDGDGFGSSAPAPAHVGGLGFGGMPATSSPAGTAGRPPVSSIGLPPPARGAGGSVLSGAAASRLRARGRAASGAGSAVGGEAQAAMQALDNYYGTEQPAQAPSDPFSMAGFGSSLPPAPAPAGDGWADLGGSATAVHKAQQAQLPSAAAAKASILANLSDLYAAANPAPAPTLVQGQGQSSDPFGMLSAPPPQQQIPYTPPSNAQSQGQGWGSRPGSAGVLSTGPVNPFQPQAVSYGPTNPFQTPVRAPAQALANGGQGVQGGAFGQYQGQGMGMPQMQSAGMYEQQQVQGGTGWGQPQVAHVHGPEHYPQMIRAQAPTPAPASTNPFDLF